MPIISKPLSAGQAQTHHQKEFTAKEQNCWSQRGVIGGEWQGGPALQFGLAGAVSAQDFARLSRCQHPQTVEQLVRQQRRNGYQDTEAKTVKTLEHRAGWEATFSLPKSVSLAALGGGDENVRRAHRKSVRLAIDQLDSTGKRASAAIIHRTFTHPLLLSLGLRSCSFACVIMFVLASAQVKEKNTPTPAEGKNVKLEEVNLRTKEAVDYLVQSLESGQSAVLTQYLAAMAKFRNYSFLCY